MGGQFRAHRTSRPAGSLDNEQPTMSDWASEYFERRYAQRWGTLPVTDKSGVKSGMAWSWRFRALWRWNPLA